MQSRFCKCGKMSFKDEQEAIDFEIANREVHQCPQQYPYFCFDSKKYHLTGTQPGTHNTTTNYDQIENSAPQKRKWTRSRELSESEKKQIFEEYKNNQISVAALASKYDTGFGRVWKVIHEPRFASPTVATIDSLILKKQQSDAESARLAGLIAAALEAARIKVVRLPDGQIKIQKEAQVIILPVEECATVIAELEEMLTAKAS